MHALPPEAVVTQLLFSKMVFNSLTSVVKLGIADHLSETPRDVVEIARDSGTHANSLYRVLRMMVSLGVFVEGPSRHFAINPAGALLRKDHPHSLRDMAIMFSDPWTLKSYTRMEDCLRTGTDGPTLEFGMHAFDYLRGSPEEGANFHRAMTSFSGGATVALLEVADFSGFKRLADCGGGHGFLLSRLMQKFPALQGVLFDLPEVVAGALATGHFAGLEDRLTIEAGSFFERVPEGCDAYIMKHIIHDWDDESCRKVLASMAEQLKKTAPETGRVFLADMVVPEGSGPAPAKMLDIEMLVCTPGGKERTEAEFAKLFASAGLRLVGVKGTKSPVCLIEAAVA